MKAFRETKKQIDELFAAYDQPHSPGFAVGIIHNGNFIFKKGFGQANLEHPSRITSNTTFDVGSMAKPFVGVAIALLEEQGQLKIGDGIHKYLPEFPNYAQGVTVGDLLYHTSGIRNYTVLAYYMIGYHESDAITKEELYELLMRQKSLSFIPGARWEYSDSNYFLLAQIVERVSSKTLSQYTREHIFTPLGMNQTLFREYYSQVIQNRAMSYASYAIAFRSPCAYRQASEIPGSYHTLVSNYEHIGAEGLFTTLEDMAKWDRNLSKNLLGKGEGALIDRILSPGQLRNGEPVGYGYGINIGTWKGERYVGHDGAIHGYTSSLMRFPERDTTVICLGNHKMVGAWHIRDCIMDLIFPASASVAPISSASDRTMADEEAQGIAGAYQNPTTASIWEIIPKDGKVSVRVNRSWDFEIIPSRSYTFKAAQPDMDLTLRFIPDDTGRIREIQGSKEADCFTLVAFLDRPLRLDELAQYAGEFHCEELQTTFLVDIVEDKIRLRNKHRHFCSMDLIYEPTIQDNFIAYDPHPESSQITFLREGNLIKAIFYRDYDGDKREDLRFRKQRDKIDPLTP